eukprot:GEMP01006217.1.p1 GENE.GEMP01006217.1~~GEMP01006217.1.p1  ORF type:complete len:657 (+),score=132.62 GEMP01006217.1:99-2069(+)
MPKKATTGFQVELRNEDGKRTWLDFPAKAAASIKAAYEAGMDEVKIKLSVNGKVSEYMIKFANMSQTSIKTGKSRKIRAPYESKKYNADGGDGEGDGLAGDDAEGPDTATADVVKQAQMKAVPPPPVVKIDPNKDKREQVAKQFKQQKESPTQNNLETLQAEAKKCEADKGLQKEIEDLKRVVGEMESALKNHKLDALPGCIKACEKAGCGSKYIEGLKKLANQARVAAGRKMVGELLEISRDTKGKDKETLEKMKAATSDGVEKIASYGIGEEELRPLRDRMRKLHNAIQDLRGAIRVFCRTRPPNQREKDMGFKSCLKFDPNGLGVALVDDDGDEIPFSFDACFNPGSQMEVFTELKELVQSALDGYNITVFAYGQTGSGKTFTMYGPITNQDALNNKDSGVVINAIKELFILKKQYESTSTVTVQVGMIELYCSKLTDLLFSGSTKAPPLTIRKAPDGEVIYEGATTKDCKSDKELWGAVHSGFESRKVTATAMNAESSRSHLILNIKVNIKNNSTGAVIKGKMTMVDLAGSERVKDSKVEGKALEEAIEINKSLTALGDVMEQLVNPKKGTTVGYRNSKLTECLQDSLGGTSKTLMFANVSPAGVNSGETMMTMKWATRANNVVNVAVKGDASPRSATSKPAVAKKKVAMRK